MKTRTHCVGLLLSALTPLLSFAQDGDHPTTNPAGRTFLAPDPAVVDALGNPVAPFNMTVGTTPSGSATLRVRGDQLPVNSAFQGGWRATFRTDVPSDFNQNWEMVRGGLQVGRLYHGADFNWFAVQAPQGNGTEPGILWLENAERDGIMLRANGLQANVNGYQLRLDGFGSIGFRGLGGAPVGMQGMPSRARWHMVDVNGDWRPNYRNGVLFTGNDDMGYIGHVYDDASEGATPWIYTLDRSDLVISAGENDMSEALRQRIRFTYTTTPVAGATSGATSYLGLEFMQCWPESTTEGFVGIGDWNAATVANGGVQVNPLDRLDVLNGRVRVRELPDPPSQNDALTKVLVVDDDMFGSDYGVLKWRDASTLLDCDWEQDVVNKELLTAYMASGTNGNCPDEDWNVFIGTQFPLIAGEPARLNVKDNIPSAAGDNWGIFAQVGGTGSARDVAIAGSANGANLGGTMSLDAVGVVGDANDALSASGVRGAGFANVTGVLRLTGVEGSATVASDAVNAYGVKAFSNTVGTTTNSYAVHAFAQSQGLVTNSYGVKTESQWGSNSSYGLHSTCLGGGQLFSQWRVGSKGM